MNRRLRILQTDYGRASGWYVERDGRRLAALTDAREEEMFWDSYRLVPLTDDVGEVAELYSDGFWDDHKRLTFRSREFGEVPPNAFPGGKAGTALRATGRVCMRGLYLAVPCYPWDRLELWRLWQRCCP
jgi:hypothetical protein